MHQKRYKLLSGCKTNGSNTTVNDVKVGDTVKNWNGLGVQLSSVFHLTQDPARPGYEYLGVRVTVLNRSKTETYTIGAQGVDAINAAYPVPPLENVDANFQAMAAATTDFVATCDGQGAAVSANISLYNSNSQSFSDSETLPPQGSGYIVLMLQVPTGWTICPQNVHNYFIKSIDFCGHFAYCISNFHWHILYNFCIPGGGTKSCLPFSPAARF